MKTVGIIGGLGPETTAEFYLRVISLCREKGSDARPPMLIWSVPLNYQIEADLISQAKGEERYIPYLIDAAKRLEQGGADFIVIPCNSVHIFIQEVRQAVNIPVLSIVDETVHVLRDAHISRVGLLATKTTIQKDLYESKLVENGIEVVLPELEQQTTIGDIIYRLVLGEENEKDKKALLNMIEQLENRGASTALLACTDLQLLIPKMKGITILDTMEILAEATAQNILG